MGAILGQTTYQAIVTMKIQEILKKHGYYLKEIDFNEYYLDVGGKTKKTMEACLEIQEYFKRGWL